MKLLKATFKNFRLLKDLTLEFSTDINRPLTVIRAANETGKTTCEYGLMWGLYGSKSALPKKGDYPLFPAGLKASGDRNVEVSVEIEFTVESIRSVGRGGQDVEESTYRINRSCIEYADTSNGVRRESERTRMFKINSSGSEPVSEVESKRIIESALPEALKDVYFTDGDSAMSFIEAAATQGVKRKRVSNAVEALLGIETLNTTVQHLGTVSKRFSQEIDNTNYKAELEQLNDRIDSYAEDILEWEIESSDLEMQITTGAKELKTIKIQIEEALKLGDKEKLVDELESTNRQIQNYRDNAEKQLQQIALLTSNKQVSKIYISDFANNAKNLLNNLNKDKKLPKVNIPILEELLDSKLCFCGADLSQETTEGNARRSDIMETIASSRESDLIQECATSLFYRVRSEEFDDIKANWTEDYSNHQSMYQNNVSSLRIMEEKLADLNTTIKELDDTMINELKDQEEILASNISQLNTRLGMRNGQIHDAQERKKEAEEERSKVEKRVGKTNTSANKLTLSRYAQSIFVSIIDRLKKEELRKVSDEMNRVFLEMIGSDPDGNILTLITEAKLTGDYDIVVFGPNGHQLNPDQDLNGASRRAITLAFILALTKVSEVEAPNVIDTPLGMMSGFVKQSVLLQTIKEGSQAILFLTHDEIKGVEEILDKHAGMVYTLTNPAHYPKMLRNEPTITDSRIIKCSCDHNQSCSICERKDVEVV
ncbi:MAG: AAA family ATPase [Gammaproteobacteria bacterium]|nr:AAA family ATPase [Gammaproteobacteria bacterium]